MKKNDAANNAAIVDGLRSKRVSLVEELTVNRERLIPFFAGSFSIIEPPAQGWLESILYKEPSPQIYVSGRLREDLILSPTRWSQFKKLERDLAKLDRKIANKTAIAN